MARNGYMVVETTALHDSVCFSLQATKDIENGAIVGKGDLVTGETSIYNALDDYAGGMYLVANPAWNYDDSTYLRAQEDAYINVANKAFRVYELKANKKFAITSYSVVNGDAVVVGDELGVDATGKLDKTVADSALIVKVTAIDNYGFAYAVGSAGTVNTNAKMITVEVVKNA